MAGDADIAQVATLLANTTRASICAALLDGRFKAAGELARLGGVSASTASEHLARLVAGGLLEADQQGRHRYFRLAGPQVAAALEAIAVLAPAGPVRSLRDHTAGEALRRGRTCYDHLAGRLGVALTDALVSAGVLTVDFALADPTPLAALAVQVPTTSRRPVVRACVDWTERRHHAAGALPAALTARLLELGWLQRIGSSRAVRLTAAGQHGLHQTLGCNVTDHAA
jgi:DNA-binding transcriptional ArsR family regulator